MTTGSPWKFACSLLPLVSITDGMGVVENELGKNMARRSDVRMRGGDAEVSRGVQPNGDGGLRPRLSPTMSRGMKSASRGKAPGGVRAGAACKGGEEGACKLLSL